MDGKTVMGKKMPREKRMAWFESTKGAENERKCKEGRYISNSLGGEK